jgi:benzoyl-CoA reductase subunit C
MLEEIMQQLRSGYSVSISDNPAIADWKKQQKLVFGYMCHNFPEEIIAAAGVFPVKFLGKPINVTEANQYQSTFMCYYGRAILELGLNGEYEQIDGLVYAYGCEGGCNLFQVLMEVVPKNYQNFLHIPHNSNAVGAFDFYLAELESFCSSLRGAVGCSLNDDDLRKAIGLYNEQRKLLKKIYELRGSGINPLLTGLEVGEILEYVVSTPKQEANNLLRQLIKAAELRSPVHFSGPRLLVQGTILPDLELYQVIEELGGMVVGDDLCQGSRYFWDLVDETAAPLEALAKHRLGRVPCSCMSSEKVAEQRLEHLLDQLVRYQADGVILAVQKWCDATQMDRPFFIEQLQDKGIPILSVEVERTAGGSQFRTRIEAFMEMMEINNGSRKNFQLGGGGK